MGTTSGDQPVLPAQPLSVAVQVCNTTPDGCAAGASYSLATLRDLAINVSWENVPVGTHLQTIEILDPSGWVYQARTQAFAIPEDWDGSAKTTETVPVSGTWIVTRRRAGTAGRSLPRKESQLQRMQEPGGRWRGQLGERKGT